MTCGDCGMRAVDYCINCSAPVCGRCRNDYHGAPPRLGCAAVASRRLVEAVEREQVAVHGKGAGEPARGVEWREGVARPCVSVAGECGEVVR